MPVVTQSKIRVNFSACQFQKTGEKRGEILAKFIADFRPSISIQNSARNFTQIPHIKTSNSTGYEPKFFHCGTLGVGGPTGKRQTYTGTSPPLFSKKAMQWGKKWPVQMNLPFSL